MQISHCTRLPHRAPKRVACEGLPAADDEQTLAGAAERDTQTVAMGDEAQIASGVAADAGEHDDVGLAAIAFDVGLVLAVGLEKPGVKRLKADGPVEML